MKKRRILTSDDILISSAAQEVNFREIHMGTIAPRMLYRSSHPIKDLKQEPAISLLTANARIAAVLNLSDTNFELKTKSFLAPWYNSLLKNNKVCALGMDFGYASANFKEKLKKGMQFIINTDGPWLIHCHAGVDRTGFVSMVLETFMGAALDEVINDYLLSFNSMYNSSIYSEVNKDDSLVVIQLISAMDSQVPINDQNLQTIAENYLRNTIKLSVVETELLKRKLAGVEENLKNSGKQM